MAIGAMREKKKIDKWDYLVIKRLMANTIIKMNGMRVMVW